MRIAMTSPSFDVVAKVPSSPRYDQTRATDRNRPKRLQAVRVTCGRIRLGRPRSRPGSSRLPRPTVPMIEEGEALRSMAARWLDEDGAARFYRS